jgi:tetratricopeptide (TPR) repeat protein
MQHCHREVLECFFQGEGGIDEAFVEDHLASCARCYRLAAEVVGTLERRRGETRKLSPSAAAFRYILNIEDARARAEVRAKGLISLLLALDSKEQKRFIRSDPRARTFVFVAALAKAARDRSSSDPGLASTLCTYGMILVDEVSSPQSSFKLDLKAEFLTELANARRIQADLKAANELLDRAHRTLLDGSGNPLLLARIGSIRASVRMDDHKPDEALILLQDVRRTYERAGETNYVGRTMVKIADIVSVFDPDGAYRIAREALGFLSRDEDLRTRAYAVGMMIECLIEQRRATEALREYRQNYDFISQFLEPALQVRVRTMEARLAALLQHDEEALQLFSDAIDECFERGLYQLMTSYQVLLLGFFLDRKKWGKAIELCTFAAGGEEIPEGIRTLWRNLEGRARARTLNAKDLEEARRLLRACWK